MTYLTYKDLVNLIKNEESGIAKGYELDFLEANCIFESDFFELITNDLALFKRIEEIVCSSATPPKVGDFVEYESGKLARIASNLGNGAFQLSNKISVYVADNGNTDSSGYTFDEELNINKEMLHFCNLKPTSNLAKGKCWMFSGGQWGEGRGVNYEINFKVWLLG